MTVPDLIVTRRCDGTAPSTTASHLRPPISSTSFDRTLTGKENAGRGKGREWEREGVGEEGGEKPRRKKYSRHTRRNPRQSSATDGTFRFASTVTYRLRSYEPGSRMRVALSFQYYVQDSSTSSQPNKTRGDYVYRCDYRRASVRIRYDVQWCWTRRPVACVILTEFHFCHGVELAIEINWMHRTFVGNRLVHVESCCAQIYLGERT